MISLSNLDPSPTSPDSKLWLYNGLDCCITREVFDAIPKSRAEPTYSFSRLANRAALDMMFLGMPIDAQARANLIQDETKLIEHYVALLNAFSEALWDKPLVKVKVPSPQILIEFFYEYLQIKPIRRRDKISGKMLPTVDKHALKKLKKSTYARPFVNLILEIRKINKRLAVPKSVDPLTSRFFFSINVAGTETGRFSSSSSALGLGSNVFNINKDMRRMFIPDPGHKIGYIDLRSAEAVVVAYLGDDPDFIDVAISSDFHTAVCQRVWPHMGWTGDLTQDRKIADRLYEGTHLTYRDYTKRIDFGTHYDGTPSGISEATGIPIDLVANFQVMYHDTFPGIRRFQQRILEELYETGELVTPFFKRRRKFYGRLSDPHTQKEGYAYKPQSMVADIVTSAVIDAQRLLVPRGLRIFNSLYDAITFQVPIGEEHLATELQHLMERSILMPSGKTMTIRASAKLGANWKEISG